MEIALGYCCLNHALSYIEVLLIGVWPLGSRIIINNNELKDTHPLHIIILLLLLQL